MLIIPIKNIKTPLYSMFKHEPQLIKTIKSAILNSTKNEAKKKTINKIRNNLKEQ